MVKIVIEDEVNVKIQGISVKVRDLLVNRFSYYVPNYIFNPKFKLGWWDGKIKLFNPTGKTYLRLLDDIVPILANQGLEIEVVDNRNEHTLPQTLIDEMYLSEYTLKGKQIILRDYQVEAINAAITEQQGLLELSTGAGKTLLCGAIAKYFESEGGFIVIVPTIDLAVQTQGLFLDIGLDAGIWYGGERKHRNVMISTWQSLDKFPELFDGVVGFIVDECHQARGPILNKILTGPAANVPIRLGCTGTLPNEELFRTQISCSIGPKLFEIKTAELQERGVLANTEITQFILNDNKNPKYDPDAHEEWREEVSWMFKDEHRIETMVEIIKEVAATGNTLVIVYYREQGQMLQKYLPDAIVLDGKNKSKERMDQYAEYAERNDVLTICTAGIASTGIDIPRLFNLVTIEIGKKFEKVLQTLGRGLRKADDKDMLYFYDIAGNAKFSSKHAKEKKRILEGAKQRVTVVPMEYV